MTFVACNFSPGLRDRPRTRAHLAPSDGSFGVWAHRDHDELTAGRG
jgi:hypothetical protein